MIIKLNNILLNIVRYIVDFKQNTDFLSIRLKFRILTRNVGIIFSKSRKYFDTIFRSKNYESDAVQKY